jgi:hypothetical protein
VKRGGRGRLLQGNSACLAELLEVLAAGGDERVTGRQSGDGDGIRPPVARLRIAQLAVHLADDGKVVERSGHVGMLRADSCFLQNQRLPQQTLGAGMVASFGGLLGFLHDLTEVVHGLHGFQRPHCRTVILVVRIG